MKKLILLFFVFIGFIANCQDADSDDSSPLKKFSFSVQGGFPSLAGVGIEYRLPILKNRITVGTNLGYLPIIAENFASSFQYFSFGSNYFFGPKSKVFYAGLDYGLLPIAATEVDGENVDIGALFQLVNSKVGIKLGNRLFYKLEMGYTLMMYDIEEANEYLNETYGVSINPAIKVLQLPNITTGLGFRF